MSHQWARELKRFGKSSLSAIHFNLPSSTIIWHGHYAKPHIQSELGEAIRQFLKLDDMNGYEFFIEQKISSHSITKFVPIRKPMGWRYFPSAHGTKPCYCPACSRRGEYGQAAGAKLWRAENEGPPFTVHEAREIIENLPDRDSVYQALRSFITKTRKDDPSFIFPVLEPSFICPDFHISEEFLERDEFLESIALRAIGAFIHPKAKQFLQTYSSDDPDIIELINEIMAQRNWSR